MASSGRDNGVGSSQVRKFYCATRCLFNTFVEVGLLALHPGRAGFVRYAMLHGDDACGKGCARSEGYFTSHVGNSQFILSMVH